PTSTLTFPTNLPSLVATPGAGISLHLPETLQLTVPANGGADIVDGRTFTITKDAVSVTFEFDRVGSFNPANRRIQYSATDTADQLAAKILAAFQAPEVAALGLAPSYLGGGVIHLGSSAGNTVNPGNSGLTVSGQASSVVEGDTFFFTTNNGANTFRFEFNNTAIDGNVSGSNIRIDFSPGQTRDQIA